MRNLLRSRKGSVAFATVVALVPVIGMVALGAEAGTWYVTKQHAQTAADAAAFSGALKLACSMGASCSDGQTVEYRGKQFAAQNAFCNAGDTSYSGSRCISSLPAGVTQSVQIATAGNLVTATINQQQKAYLAAILGLTTVNIGATASAQVVTLAHPCVLSLVNPVAFQGSTTVSAPTCGLASNSTASNSMDFTGNGLDVSNVASISGQGGCQQTGGTDKCSKTITYAPPVPDPLSGLQAPMEMLSASDFANSTGVCSPAGNNPPIAYTATTRCVNNNYDFKSNGNGGTGNYPLNGVYFFSGNLRIQGGTITGTATIVLLTGASLTINGNPTIQLTALSTVSPSQVPADLTSVVGLMSKLLIYDPETTNGNQTVTISGNSTSYFNGITYAPNANVTYQGSTQAFDCTQVIAKGVTLSGNSNFDNSGCPASSRIESHIVKLVQ